MRRCFNTLLFLALQPGILLGGERKIDYRSRIWSDTRPAINLTKIFTGEITERKPYNGYLIFQGGIPEVEEFIKKFHK